MAEEVMLCHASTPPQRVVDHLVDGQPASWLVLCSDYLRYLQWQAALSQAQLVDTSVPMEAATERLRQPFLDWITEQGSRHNSVAWWASRISERNTLVSPLFLYCCYLEIGSQALRDIRGTLCIICESRAVLESLADLARQRDIPVKWAGSRISSRNFLTTVLGRIRRVARVMCTGLLGRLFAPRLRIPTSSQPVVLLRSWANESSLGTDGTFKDLYLPSLSEWLQNRGSTVVTVPVVSGLERSSRAAWRWFKQSRDLFLIPEAYYRGSDYLFALREAHRATKMPGTPAIIDGLDVSKLVVAQRRHSAFDGGTLQSLLSYRLPTRLEQAGLNIDLFIDLFENMIPEKAFVLGFRESGAKTKLVGFQHATLFPTLLCLFVTEGEARFAPLPDRVVCNGELFRDILLKEGLPAERAVVGPALRYQHLWDGRNRSPARAASPALILVTLPMVQSAAVALLVKASLAFRNRQDLRVVLKPHPMGAPREMMKAAGMSALPANFELRHGTMRDWLLQAQVLVTMGSGTIHEALAYGVPLVIARQEGVLDFNPLAWEPGLDTSFTSPEDIRAETLRLLALSPEALSAYRQRGADLLRRSFNPVTDRSMSAFVDGLITLPGRSQE